MVCLLLFSWCHFKDFDFGWDRFLNTCCSFDIWMILMIICLCIHDIIIIQLLVNLFCVVSSIQFSNFLYPTDFFNGSRVLWYVYNNWNLFCVLYRFSVKKGAEHHKFHQVPTNNFRPQNRCIRKSITNMLGSRWYISKFSRWLNKSTKDNILNYYVITT